MSSEWPLTLMLDEVWLRVRRLLVHELEASGHWPSNAAHRAFFNKQLALGEKLRSEVLFRALGADDFSAMNSETIFGRAGDRFSARVPLVLAFGYELGSAFYGLLKGGLVNEHRIAAICAVFNLGISIFDLVQDRYPELVDRLSEVFDEEALILLADRPRAGSELEARIVDVSEPELRILLRIIAWFYLHIHHVSAWGEGSDAWRGLRSSLLHAYRAEVGSATTRKGPEALSVSQTKSTLPFAVIHYVARLCTGGWNPAVDALARRIGVIFWVIDDLVDIISDYRDGAVNSILVRAAEGWEWNADPLGNYTVLSRLLREPFIDQAVAELHQNLVAVVQSLHRDTLPDTPARRLAEVIPFYVRNWLG